MGKFIVFEGLDGTGKTTQLEMLKNRMTEKKIPAAFTREPTENEIGKLIRKIISGNSDFNNNSLATLFLADRIEHNLDSEEGILSLLEENKYVFSDRYYYSTLAYQQNSGNLQWLIEENINCPFILKPDLCIFLDIEPEVSMERILKNRDTSRLDIFENLETQAGIRANFYRAFEMLKNENIKIINADDTPESIHRIILDEIEKL